MTDGHGLHKSDNPKGSTLPLDECSEQGYTVEAPLARKKRDDKRGREIETMGYVTHALLQSIKTKKRPTPERE
jgi:hypothetical protein